MIVTIRQKIGAVVYDLPRFAWAMRPYSNERKSGGAPWLFMRNRDERLTADASGAGARCEWQWTSDLHVARVFPSLGRRLMVKALRQYPVELFDAPPARRAEVKPAVSFIIGHRGLDRLPHLLLTLKSIAAQSDVSPECIVVEQSDREEIRNHLPAWVRYIHTPLPYRGMAYSRSWAFNVGARHARGELLVFQDNDMLAPRAYAARLLAHSRQGYEVVNLKRFVFYLTEGHSKAVMSSGVLSLDAPPETVVQNLEAGGGFAMSRDAYFDVGGFDESFVGWGGEDNEFWERAMTRVTWPYGYMPILHLWHAPQAGKNDLKRQTAELFNSRVAIPAHLRIEELRAREFGRIDGFDASIPAA